MHLGMLLCLDRDHRLIYVLGDVFGLTSREGGEIVGISPAAFRKRLSRARQRLHGFMARKCGLVDSANPCRCARRVEHAVRVGRVDPDRLLFAAHPVRHGADAVAREAVREMEQLHSAADLLRGHPDYAAPGTATEVIRSLLDQSPPLRVLQRLGHSVSRRALSRSRTSALLRPVGIDVGLKRREHRRAGRALAGP